MATSYTTEEPEDCCSVKSVAYCCETIYSFVRISDSQKPTAVQKINYTPVASFPNYNFRNNIIKAPIQLSPPVMHQFPEGSVICISNCTFLI
ncbi:MAG: hypothetical protein CVV24_01915 [Ignavibacteriae bacterium HGW-Ignavibacteriae-3]|nr:MAG: hypothetical protein CVV24_01915 [Ignavibacteriae bacterium HGW-Ignavibacteriae-3]